RDHLTSAKIAPVVELLGSPLDKRCQTLLRQIAAKNPHQEVRAEAQFALCRSLRQAIDLRELWRNSPEAVTLSALVDGKKAVEELQKADLMNLKAESEKQLKALADDHLGNLKEERLLLLCNMLKYSADAGSEAVLRALSDKHKSRAVQGFA